jgi:hypothetical protein
MALLPPPTNWLIEVPTSQEARAILNDFAAQQGYAITVKNSNDWSAYLHCDRSGQPRRHAHPPTGKRSYTSRRCGCHFSAYLARVIGGWLFTVREGTHSGHIASEPAAHPIHRRRQLAELRQRVLHLFMLHHTNLEVINILRQEGAYGESSADIVDPYRARIRLNRRDLRNLRYRARKQFLKGRSPTSALLLGLPGWEIL